MNKSLKYIAEKYLKLESTEILLQYNRDEDTKIPDKYTVEEMFKTVATFGIYPTEQFATVLRMIKTKTNTNKALQLLYEAKATKQDVLSINFWPDEVLTDIYILDNEYIIKIGLIHGDKLTIALIDNFKYKVENIWKLEDSTLAKLQLLSLNNNLTLDLVKQLIENNKITEVN
jgi:hypothetical protein